MRYRHPRRLVSAIALVAMLVASIGATVTAAPAQRERVIVVLNPGAGSPAVVAAEVSQRYQGQVTFVYQHALQGFALELPAPAVAAIARDARVAFVEPDQIVTAFGVPTGVDRIEADKKVGATDDGSTSVSTDVDVAILDTGIDAAHPDLDVRGGVNCSNSNPFWGSCSTGGFDDGNGHGTHVSGTVAARDNGSGVVGVAPGARLWAVKVLRNDGSGYMSGIVAGIDWVTENAGVIEVANMSLGCECSSSALDQALNNSTDAGVVYVVAAGNNGSNASTFSPANHPEVIAVSAMADFDGKPGALASPTCRSDAGADDTFATFSNYGSVVDIAAPGVCITSTVPGGGYAAYSGTSMASPHVAGAAALYVVENGTPRTASRWSTVRSGLQSSAWSVTQGSSCGFTGGKSAERSLMLASCDTGTTPTTGTIAGAVTDASGAPLAGATVSAAGLTTTTGSNGAYTLANVPAGSQQVTAGKDGYVSASQSVDVVAGATATTSFSLDPVPASGALSVSVTTDKASYTLGQTVTITATVTDGSAAVSGAGVSLTIQTASGRTYAASATTDAAGKAVFTFKSKKPDGKGAYTATASASKAGYTSGQGSTSFTVS